MEQQERFFQAEQSQLKVGYTGTGKDYQCLLCEHRTEQGVIYASDDRFVDAKRSMEDHVKQAHGGVMKYLLSQPASIFGLSDAQIQVVGLMADGLADKEIASRLGIAMSTVRNYRFKLREKELQAKHYLVLMQLLGEQMEVPLKQFNKEQLIDPHLGAKMTDERYNITDKETAEVLEAYFNKHGALKTFPSKEKKKIIVLRAIMGHFSKGKRYSEVEVNRLLKRIYEDQATLRRALIEYGFLDRTNDNKEYWVKESNSL